MNLRKSLESNQLFFNFFAIIAAFVTYSCMYAFRKPFTAATFEGMEFWGIDYKVLLIVAQVFGYTLSKFIGIKVVSEMGTAKRAFAIFILLSLAAISLLCFALAPSPYNLIFMFLNGLPLGMVWGIVFSFLEGRRTTEVLGAGLSISFIFSSGFVKTIGKTLMQDYAIDPFWMPFATGMLFVPILIISLYMLNQLPEPSAEDISHRTKREPMTKKQRVNFFREFAPGLILLILAYSLLTTFRDFRDNFAAEIWEAVGYGNNPEMFTLTEIPVSIAVLIIMGLLMLFRNNYRALMVSHLMIIFGFFLTGVSSYVYSAGLISAPVWMALVGFGLYLGYVPFNSMFFDRLIATFKYVSNVGFLIYLADSFGYLGSVGILLFKNFGTVNISWYNFFIDTSYIAAILGVILVSASMLYFRKKHQNYFTKQK